MFHHLTGSNKIVLPGKSVSLRSIEGIIQTHPVPCLLKHQGKSGPRARTKVQTMTIRSEQCIQWTEQPTKELTITFVIRQILMFIILCPLSFRGRMLSGRHINEMTLRATKIITIPITIKTSSFHRVATQWTTPTGSLHEPYQLPPGFTVTTDDFLLKFIISRRYECRENPENEFNLYNIWPLADELPTSIELFSFNFPGNTINPFTFKPRVKTQIVRFTLCLA